jgi:HSP20 family protein
MFPVLRNNNSASAHSPVAMGPINRLDWLLNPFFGDDGGFRGRAWSGAPVAMWEDDDHIHLEAELPGVSDDDVEVTVHNGTLFIRGERKPEQGRRYLYNDREYGRFEQIVNLPEAVMTDGVQASLTHGVLRVDLPKCPQAKPKKITLQAS